ncbi:MAG: rhodanese-like domain-containing protein [Chthoniobacteraceae bacterium]
MKNWLKQAAVLVLLAILPALLGAWLNPKRPSWQSDEMTVSAAQSLGTKAIWVDARPASDFEKAHVSGAISLNEDAWSEMLPPLLDAWSPDKTVVVYCSSLSCHTSREVANRLRDEVGLSPVFVLQGGWEAWTQSQKGGR